MTLDLHVSIDSTEARRHSTLLPPHS